MDDYWLDAARPRRRNWWDPDQDDGQQPDYPPVGLEGFRPEQPPTIGFDVKAPEPEPHEEFAQAWTKASEAGSEAPQERARNGESSGGEQGVNEVWNNPDQASSSQPFGSYDWRQYGSPWVTPAMAGTLAQRVAAAAAGLAATAGPAIAATGRAIASGVDSAMKEVGPRAAEIAALLNPLHAPRLLTNPADWGATTTDLGNGNRFVERRDGTASIRESDGGFLGTGIGESTETLPVDARVVVRSDGTREHVADWDALERRIGYDKTLEAMQKWPAGMGGDSKEPDDPPPPKPAIPIPPDYFTRRLMRKYPDLIKRDTDHWAREGVEPNDAEREHEDACRAIQKQQGEAPPDGAYSGADALVTPFGRVPPSLGQPEAQNRPENKNHEAGIVGETQMAIRLHNLGLSHSIIYYGNPPGVNGPDGIAASNKHRGMMFLESKYSTNPRAIGGSQADISEVNPKLVDDRLQAAGESKRISEELAKDARESLRLGNYSKCTVGTGNAHNGFVVHYRDGEPVIVKRIR